MERELFICSCENTEHQIVFSWFENDDVANVYATIHLRKKSFWTRLKYGIKYIFGYQCKYGAFDEFIFNPNDAKRLQKVVNFLKEEGNDMTREDIVNSYSYKVAKASVDYSQKYAKDDEVQNIVIDTFVDSANFGYNLAVEKACDVLLNAPIYSSPMNPTRFVNDFRKAMKGE